MIDKILIELLIMDGNETHYIKNAETYNAFNHLLKELTKIKYNIRYCSGMNCPCHPEHAVKMILNNNNNLIEFLNEYCSKTIVDEIKDLITDYKPIISKAIYEDSYEK